MHALSKQKGAAPIAPPKPIQQLVQAGCSTSCFALAYTIWEQLVEHHAATGYFRKPLSIPRLVALMRPLGYSESSVKRAKRQLLEARIIDRVPGNGDRSTDMIGMPAIFGHDAGTGGSVTPDNADGAGNQSPGRTVVSFPNPSPSSRPDEGASPCPAEQSALPQTSEQRGGYDQPSNDQLEQWKTAKDKIRQRMDPDDYTAWIEPLGLDSLRGAEATRITAPNDMILELALTEYRAIITQACADSGLPKHVEAKGAQRTGNQDQSSSTRRSRPPLPRLRKVLPSQMAETLRQIEAYVEQKRPTESAETLFRWVVFQLVYLPASNRHRFIGYESALKGLMKMLYNGTYRRPKGFEACAVDDHWAAAMASRNPGNDAPATAGPGEGQE